MTRKSDYLIHKFSGGIQLLIRAVLFSCCLLTAVGAAPEPGTVTIVLAAEPATLDPGDSAKSNVGFVVENNVMQHLTELNGDGSVSPSLATSWSKIDANTWQFVLRKGVKFHDGEDFNANAVLFNFKRLYDQRIPIQARTKFFSGIEMTGKALDSHTLEIKTEKPQLLMPTLMSILSICSPNTPLDKLTRNPIGTGPYKFVKWDAGTQIVLEAFDGYWGKKPEVKKGLFVWRKESAVRANMVTVGEADLAPVIALQDARNPGTDFSYLNSETLRFRIGGKWMPPLNDKRVRLALNYAIDRDALRGSILSKDVIPAAQMVGPSIAGRNPDLKVWPYDPKKAKQLLDEARKDGVPVDKEILLLNRMGMFAGDEEFGEAAMSMYRAVGLNVKFKNMEAGQYTRYQVKPFPTTEEAYLLMDQHDNSKGDAAFTAYYLYGCNGMSSPFCDKSLDELIQKAQVSADAERKNSFQAVFKRVHEDVVSEVVMFHMVGYTRVGSRINYKADVFTSNQIRLDRIGFKS